MNFDHMLTAIRESLKNAPSANLSAQAAVLMNQIKELHGEMIGNTKIQFTIFGEFNAGKSTVLNALLGAEISPTSILPTTAVNLYVEYDELPSATVTKREAGGSLVKMIDLRDISGQAKMQLLEKGMSAPEGVEAVKIKWPIAVLKNNGVIVDTPGLADNKERSQIARSEMNKTDIALYVLRSEQLLNEEEMRFLQELATLVNGNLIFVMNMKDAAAHAQMAETTQYVKTMLKQIQSQLWEGVVIFPINALMAFEDRLAHKIDGAGSLALNDLERWIGNVLQPNFSAKIRLTSRMKRLQQYLAQLEQTLKQDIEQQNKHIKQVESELREEHREDVRSFQREVREVTNRLEKAKQEDIGKFIDNFVKKYRVDAGSEIRTNIDWDEPIREMLRSAYQNFCNELTEHITYILRSEFYDLYREIDLSDFSVSWQWTTATYFHGNLGEKISTIFRGESEDDFAVMRVKEDAWNRRSGLRKQAEQLIDKVLQDISNYERKNRPNIQNYLNSGRLEDVKEELRQYTQTLQWCSNFREKLK